MNRYMPTPPVAATALVSAQESAEHMIQKLYTAHLILDRVSPDRATATNPTPPAPIGLLLLLEYGDRELDDLLNRLERICTQVGLL